MKQNYFMKQVAALGRWLATTLFCFAAIAVFFNSPALATPNMTLIATADAGSQIQGKVSEDAGRTKNFVRDAAKEVKSTANKNADRVAKATDDDSLLQKKAERDTARIEKRANEDAARTQEAIDNTKNVVERTIDGIKDAFN